jgi:CDGSH iron-sulfur domain-containing protein 3
MDERLIAQKAPFKVEVEAGKADWWCACGRSAAQPLCDGSHKGTALAPVKYQAERAGPVWFCGCKRTAVEPTCDGSHRAL